MKTSALLFLLLAVLPLAALAGKDDDAADADEAVVETVDDGEVKDLADPAEEPKADKGLMAEMFGIPANQTFEEWFAEQFEAFNKNDYNEWQKNQFQHHERQRFIQWQQQKYHLKQQTKFQALQAEHQKYMMRKGKELERLHQKFLKEQEANAKAEQQRHEVWLKALLADPNEREELMKEIYAMEKKEKKEL